MSDRDYLSIGEVLALLLEEFPDVTISKIRFLESQGLIEPERTPSGYRKFTTAEVDRLRFILREQRTNYLPLRIIKDKLEDDSQDISRDMVLSGEAVSTSGHPAARAVVPRPAVIPSVSAVVSLDQDPIVPASQIRALRKEAIKHADHTESVPRDLLLQQVDIDPSFLKDLESAGLVAGHDVGDTTFFDPYSASIARTAGRFQEMGIDIRHLRAWKSSADRELSLFEQRILPLLRQRNPVAREEALDMLTEFMELGAELRNSLLMRDIARLMEQR
ncbi:MAG: MerR family transcriptional regulator [Ilumatobacteraceae bacterium]